MLSTEARGGFGGGCEGTVRVGLYAGLGYLGSVALRGSRGILGGTIGAEFREEYIGRGPEGRVDGTSTLCEDQYCTDDCCRECAGVDAGGECSPASFRPYSAEVRSWRAFLSCANLCVRESSL